MRDEVFNAERASDGCMVVARSGNIHLIPEEHEVNSSHKPFCYSDYGFAMPPALLECQIFFADFGVFFIFRGCVKIGDKLTLWGG